MTMLQDSNETMFQRRLQYIASLPDGPEKDAAMQQLSQDYPGKIEDLASDRKFYGDMAKQSMPKGRTAGSSANPFSVYVGANPLEIAAAAGEKFMGHRERKKAQDAITGLRTQAQTENRALLEAGVQAEQARALRNSEDEEKRKYWPWGSY